jgi:hypothetical protein
MDVQNLRLAIWNARGLNNPARRTAVRVAVADAMASVVCVSESKLHHVSAFDIVECFGPRFDGFAYLPALGTAGGVIVAWASQDVTVLRSRVDTFSVSVEISQANGPAWWLTAVYGPTIANLRPLDDPQV